MQGAVLIEARRIRVTGRVQGVGFRYFSCEQARRQGLLGWVQNEPDGAVTGWLQGNTEAVQRMLLWLEQGPDAARVLLLEVETCELDPGLQGFDIRR
ncbi:acylphosphatase [Marinobacterium aestuarii]|uniref:Acylphosphatase n=1 Tax=Marinobacterium aestuarii TaxID=1821621 RepID=A0A1A9F0A8_9GAMM|nr:acylphosphatase [Marinobacterium aestuarii]ANG63331.1 acylphosphatase [Marinobacterium aestuarii]